MTSPIEHLRFKRSHPTLPVPDDLVDFYWSEARGCFAIKLFGQEEAFFSMGEATIEAASINASNIIGTITWSQITAVTGDFTINSAGVGLLTDPVPVVIPEADALMYWDTATGELKEVAIGAGLTFAAGTLSLT